MDVHGEATVYCVLDAQGEVVERGSGEKEVQRGRGVEAGRKKFPESLLCAFREIRLGSSTILAFRSTTLSTPIAATSIVNPANGGFTPRPTTDELARAVSRRKIARCAT